MSFIRASASPNQPDRVGNMQAMHKTLKKKSKNIGCKMFLAGFQLKISQHPVFWSAFTCTAHSSFFFFFFLYLTLCLVHLIIHKINISLKTKPKHTDFNLGGLSLLN